MSPRTWRRSCRLIVERLEDRLAPASSITIQPGTAGSGSLDGFLSPTDGTITTADGGAAPGTLSTGALQAVHATTSISISAISSITFDPLPGPLLLQTGAGNSAAFDAGSGPLTMALANTLATSGGSLVLTAGTSAALAILNSGGGDIIVAADTIDVPQPINAGVGRVTLLPFTAGRAIDLGVETAGRLSLTAAELDRVRAGGLQVGNAAAGNITLAAAVTLTNTTTLLLRTGAGIVDGTAAEQPDLTVLSLAMQAVSGIGSSDDLDLGVADVAVSNTTSGNIQLSGSEIPGSTAFRFDAVAGVIGATNSAPAGAINATTSGIPLIVFRDVLASGDIIFTVPDSAGDNNRIGVGGVRSTAGNIVLQAGDTVTAGRIQADVGTVTLTGGFNGTDGNGGGVTLRASVTGSLVLVQGGPLQDVLDVQRSEGASPLIVAADALDLAHAGFRFFGNGTDNTLRLTGPAFTLNLLDSALLDKLLNLQTIDLRTSAANYTVPLTKTPVRSITGNNRTLIVTGDAGDVVQIGNRWLVGVDEVIGGVTFNVYTHDDVTVKVQQGVSGAFDTQTQALPIFAIDRPGGHVNVKLQNVNGAAGGNWAVPALGQFLEIAVGTYGAFEAPVVFGLGVDHRVYVARFRQDGTLLDGWVTFAPGSFDALATATHGRNGAPIVFALGTASAGRQIYAARFNEQGRFRAGWSQVAPGQFSSVAAGTYNHTTTAVFAIGLDNRVYYAGLRENGTLDQGWGAGPPVAASALAVAPLSFGKLEVFVLGLDQQVRFARWDGGFTSFFLSGPAGSFTALTAAGVAGSDVILFGIGTDGQVRRATFDHETGAARMGFAATAPGGFTRIAATSVFNFVELYGLGGDQVFGALFSAGGSLISGFFTTAPGTFSRVALK